MNEQWIVVGSNGVVTGSIGSDLYYVSTSDEEI